MRTLQFLIVLLFFGSLSGEMIDLTGHLGVEKLDQASELVDAASGQIILKVNSTSGDLQKILQLSKRIYEKKRINGLKIEVYIDQQAIGPAAIFPFLSDRLTSSLFVSWGDIVYGSEEVMPLHLLRSEVLGLIDDGSSKGRLFSELARAMVDPNFEPSERGITAQKGEALVISHKQMNQLSLVDEVFSKGEFDRRFEQEPKTSVIQVSGIQSKLEKHIHYKKEGPNTVGHILIDDRTAGINQSTWLYVKSALDSYKKSKPAFVILELNTPGGEVFASQKISDALKELDTQHKIPVVAFINNWAISAGAMLAYSCRFIAIAKDASMGAAEPVLAGEGGQMQTASEKINSALRTDFSNRAAFFDRNSFLAEAMVDKDVILVKRHGKILKLDREDQIKIKGPSPDKIISSKGKLLTLSADEMIQLKVADLETPSTALPVISQSEKEKGKWPAEKEPLFQIPFFKQIPGAIIDTYQMDWNTQILAWLSHPVVSSLLFMGLLIGFYVEVSSPGFGVPGSVGLLCLFLVLLSSFALDAVHWLEVIFLFAGLVMILVDLLLIPTFGILGFFGVILFVGGLFGLMLPGLDTVTFEFDTQTFNAAGEFVLNRFVWLCGTLVATVIAMALLGRYAMPHLGPFSRFVLKGHEQTVKEGYVAGEKAADLPQPGATGKVIGMLRPTGKVEIEGRYYHAVTRGNFLGDGETIVVDHLDGSVLVVLKSEEEVV